MDLIMVRLGPQVSRKVATCNAATAAAAAAVADNGNGCEYL